MCTPCSVYHVYMMNRLELEQCKSVICRLHILYVFLNIGFIYDQNCCKDFTNVIVGLSLLVSVFLWVHTRLCFKWLVKYVVAVAATEYCQDVTVCVHRVVNCG